MKKSIDFNRSVSLIKRLSEISGRRFPLLLVCTFLLGKGVEAQTISSKDFDVKEKMGDFASSGGKIFACGTCLRQRNQEGSKLCPVSSLSDLYEIIKKSEKVLPF